MKINKENVKDILPLSSMQEGMLFHYLADGNRNYIEHLVINTGKKLDESVFIKTWEIIASRYDALRSVFKWKKLEKPVQIILYDKKPEITVYSDDADKEAAESRIDDKGIRLDEAPYYLLLCQSECNSTIHLVYHHILMDGWSLGIVVKEFLEIYQLLIKGDEIPQLRKNALRECIGNSEKNNSADEKAYWSEELKGYQVKHGVRPLFSPKSEYKRIDHAIEKKLWNKMEALCKKHHFTMADLLYSAWGLTMQRFLYDTDIVFGTIVSGRNTGVPNIENEVGMFINTVPVRIKTDPTNTAAELVESVHKSVLKRYDYEKSSLTDIGNYTGTKASELFDSIVAIENYPLQIENLMDTGTDCFGEMSFSMEEYTNYPLTVVIDANNEYRISVIYDTELYEEFTVESMLGSLSVLLNDITDNPQKLVKDLKMISDSEKNHIIRDFNDTVTDYPREESIVSLFRKVADKLPDHTALVYKGKRITYKELDQRSDRIAYKLMQAGVEPEQCIAIMCNKSPEAYVGLLGILKAQGVYVPINPEYPMNRKEFILKDTKAKILLCNCEYDPNWDLDIIDLNEEMKDDSPVEPEMLCTVAKPDQLAYIIYTSGSTGNPKGIMIEHRSVIRLVRNTNFISVDEKDRFLPTSPLEFDASTFEIWMPLLNGAEIWILDKKEVLSPQILSGFIRDNSITKMWMTAPLFNQMVQIDPCIFSTLEYLIIGGDALSPYHLSIVRKACRDLKIVNGYGPTENTVFSTTFPIESEYETRVPIGRPISNSTAYILDCYGHIAPVGAIGEICTGLDGVGRGYYGNEKLTNEKFVDDIVFPGRKMYRTGDLARFMPDGVIDFFGRKDYQVKIRGFRIELTEIENMLNQHEMVNECVIIPTDKGEYDKILVAYIQKKGDVKESELRLYLNDKLPDYCMPSSFVFVDSFPLTVNGKIDRSALKRIDNSITMPSLNSCIDSETEDKIRKVWEKVLKRPVKDNNTNFFEMGGTSLHLIQLASQLEKEFSREITVVDLFKYTTIHSLAEYLNGENERDVLVNEESKSESVCEKEEIAVIGMAGRFPGANTLKRFYENIRDGRECISFFTKEELEEVDEQLLNNENYVRAKGVINGIEFFDPQVFGYSDREAELMDPQSRLLHECVFHALEDGGYMNEKRKETGLFVGAVPNIEWLMRIKSDIDDEVAVWEAANLNFYSLAAPVAYKLDMHGPVVMNSTACSSSLVALHNACKALLDGECEMAVAAGVSVSLPVKSGYLYHDGMIRSKDGKCRPFRIDSCGTTTGDGVGAVLLKPLSKAKRDKDYIYAVIKGSAVNNDGSRKAGYTAPSIDGQSQVIRAALRNAGVNGNDVRYIETHGTGTPIGDAIELRALMEAYDSSDVTITALGSVKAGIGHLDCAAGIAGFIKTALCLKNRIIPQSVHGGVQHKQLDGNGRFYLNEQTKKWHSENGVYQAAISGFGIGGTNVHMIMEEPPEISDNQSVDKWEIVLLSAMKKTSLYQQYVELSDNIDNEQLSLKSIAGVLQTGRINYDFRSAFVVKSKEELKKQLSDAIANGEDDMKVTKAFGKKTVVFLFPGQGSQYYGSCKDLYENNSLYRDCLDSCFDTLSGDHSELKDYLLGKGEEVEKSEKMKQTKIVQPLLFILEYSLATLLIKLGICPDTMIGHSLGEYTAAVVAGVMSFKDAFELISVRAELMQGMERGVMISVAATQEDVRKLLDNEIIYDIAAINSPNQTVISGSIENMERAQTILSENDVVFVRLKVSHAFHSSMMEPMIGEFRSILEKIVLNKPSISYISCYTGDTIRPADAISPEYYIKHLRNTVQFVKGAEKLAELEGALYVEVGCGNTLTRLIENCMSSVKSVKAVSVLPKEHKKDEGSRQFASALAFLWENGCDIDWYKQYEKGIILKKPLPGYCFDRRKYWKYGKKNTSDNMAAKKSEITLYEPKWVPVNDSGIPEKTYCFDSVLLLADNDDSADGIERSLRTLGKTLFRKDYKGIVDISDISMSKDEKLLVMLKASEAVLAKNTDELLLNYNSAKTGVFRIMRLLKSLHERFKENSVYVFIVTNNMEKIKKDDLIDPFSSMIKGLINTICNEYPLFRAAYIDIPSDEFISCHKRIIDGLRYFIENTESNRLLAVRGNSLFKLCYVQRDNTVLTVENSALRHRGVYLITGGLGGIGMAISKRLAYQYSADLILLTHSAFPEREEWGRWLNEHNEEDRVSDAITRILDFESHGAKVSVIRTSLSDTDELGDAFRRIRESYSKIDGVFHTAGLGDHTFFDYIDEKHMERILEPKVTGTICLYKQLLERFDEKPTFAVLFSSIASIIGGIGQAAYACANAFLDGFAKVAGSYGIRTVSINWDTWNEAGMAVRAAKTIKSGDGNNNSNETDLFKGHGLRTHEGIDILFDQIQKMHYETAEQVAVTDGELFSQIEIQADILTSIEGASHQEKKQRPVLKSEYEGPVSDTEKDLVELLEGFTGITPVGVNDNFFELGITSLSIIQINNTINKKYAKDRSIVKLYTYPTCRKLAAYLVGDDTIANNQTEFKINHDGLKQNRNKTLDILNRRRKNR